MNDTTKMERIAFRSTQGSGRFEKRRWTELAVYVDRAAAGGRMFIAESKGCSSNAGETDRAKRFAHHSLDVALGWFATAPGMPLAGPARAIEEQARGWLAGNPGDGARGTYSEAQREAAMNAAHESMTINLDGFDAAAHEDRGVLVDAVAAALGLKRETARG